MIKERTLTVAVLPFVNVSADPRIDEIGEAIAYALRTCLENADALCVSCDSQNTTGDYDVHVSELGRKMHADALLFGCICDSGGVIRARVQLVEACTGRVKWSTHVESPTAIPEAIADEVATDLERAIYLNL